MGDGESKCKKCGSEGVQVSDKPDYKDWCKRCVEVQLAKDALEISNMQDTSRHQKEKLQHELEKKKREAELELKEREAKLEREQTLQKVEAAKKNQLAQLQVQVEMNKAEYERAKQLDEKKGNEIKRRLEEEMNSLKIKEERVRIQAEEKIKQAEWQEQKRAADLKEEYERQEKEQALKYAKENQDLDLQLKKRDAAFKQHVGQERLEMEKEFNKRANAEIKLQTASGNTATLKFSNDINPELASILVGATKNPAIEQPQHLPVEALPSPPTIEEQPEPVSSRN